MAALIIDSLLKMSLAIVLTIAAMLIIPELGQLGGSKFQSFVIVSFMTFCSLVLFTPSKHKLYHLLSIPFYTQFVHIFQKFDFPGGANSLWRIAPFILSACYMTHLCLTLKVQTTVTERLRLVIWFVILGLGLISSPNFGNIGVGGLLIYLILLPQFYLVFKIASAASDYAELMDMYCCVLFIILAAGTIGLVLFASQYHETDNLLATRNIADTNITMAYFILLWPFSCNYLLRKRFPKLSISVLAALFLTIVVLSFSRGAILIVAPYILISLLFLRITGWWILIALILFIQRDIILTITAEQDLLYFWSLRFAGVGGVESIWDTLQQASGRAEIQVAAYQLFLKRPLLGNGIGSFEVLGPGFREAHSLFYTLLCEQGLIGTSLMYIMLLVILKKQLSASQDRSEMIFALSFVAYLIFSHTVGSVFVILTAKSISVNYIAPLLLICQYFRADHVSKINMVNAAQC